MTEPVKPVGTYQQTPKPMPMSIGCAAHKMIVRGDGSRMLSSRTK